MKSQCDSGYPHQRSVPPEVLLFGGGACANLIAANLVESGIAVHRVAGSQSQQAQSHAVPDHSAQAMELVRCRGFAGKFELLLSHGSRSLTMTVPVVIVAEDAAHTPNYGVYGLQPGPGLIDVAALEKQLQQPDGQRPFKPTDRIAFLSGWQRDSHPAVAKRMLEVCCQLQTLPDITTYFFTGDLQVAADGAEAQVQQAKESGTMFLKFSEDCPVITPLNDDRFEITCIDELVRQPFRMHADWIVVDETITPTAYLAELAQRLGIHLDAVGFAQADNVRRMSNATNRRGMFVAGGGRGILSTAQQRADADQVSLQVLAFLRELETDTPPQVIIQRGRCARCLTCHRLCPHLAIDVGARITVVPEACQQCGICVAGCPAQAIEMKGVRLGREIDRRLKSPAIAPGGETAGSRIVVFGCARSAGQARELIRVTGRPLPKSVDFVQVPCAGTVAGRHLLDALASGADGVMLCPCHTDNCQSEVGNQVARKRAAAASELLSAAGVDARRLRISSVAANQGTELADMIAAFAAEMAALEDQ